MILFYIAEKLGAVSNIVTGFCTGNNLRFIKASSKEVKGDKIYDLVNPVIVDQCTSIYGIPDVEESYIPYIKSRCVRENGEWFVF